MTRACTVLAFVAATGCGGGASGAKTAAGPSASDDGASSEPAGSIDSEPPEARSQCTDGTCFECGDGICPTGFYCDESASGGPACSWMPGCMPRPSCSCLEGKVGDCSCTERDGHAFVTCT